MTQPTVRERLDQIRSYKLPYTSKQGNQLHPQDSDPNADFWAHGEHPGETANVIVGTLDGTIVELVLGVRNAPNEFRSSGVPTVSRGYAISSKYAQALSDASGGILSEEDFGTAQVIPGDKIECHAFYDPKSDTTHYFILPSRAAIAQKE